MEVPSTAAPTAAVPAPTAAAATPAAPSSSSSSDLQICVVGINKFWNRKRARKFLSENGIEFESLRKGRGSAVAFLTFRDAEQKRIGSERIVQLNGPRGKPLRLGTVNPPSRKRKRGGGDVSVESAAGNNLADGKRRRSGDDDQDGKLRDIRDVVTPLWRVPYEEQLRRKQGEIVQALKRVRRKVRKEIIAKHRAQQRQRGASARLEQGDDGMDWSCFPSWLDPKYNKGEDESVPRDPSLPPRGLACPLGEIISTEPAEARSGYRNKCEFTIGYCAPAVDAAAGAAGTDAAAGADPAAAADSAAPAGAPPVRAADASELITTGFRVGRFHSTLAVQDPSACVNVPEAVKSLVASFNSYLRSQELPAFSQETKTGFWRLFTVKHSARTRDMIVIVQIRTADVDASVVASAKESLCQWAQREAKSADEEGTTGARLTGLFTQFYDGVSSPSPNDPSAKASLLFGTPYLREQLLGVEFHVSPDAFFQVNTVGAERLFTAAAELAGLVAPTALTAGGHTAGAGDGKKAGTCTVLDVCCGAGAIGLCLAALAPERVKKVVGIELSKDAVADARKNAVRNNMGRAYYFASKAEDVMGQLLSSNPQLPGDHAEELQRCGVPILEGESCIAVVDPPRGGLHPSVIRALRSCREIDTLVYISCNPTKSFVEDAIKLCLPEGIGRRSVGKPFVPMRSQAVDMFPHTGHCELVTLFRRQGAES